MTTEAFPLSWPDGRPRTERHRRESSRFRTTFGTARDQVIHEIELLAGRTIARSSTVISTNLALRRDGYPLAAQRSPDDPGVAVYFQYKKRQMCFACDRWRRIEDNMQAIAKTIAALRGVARWGTGDMMEAAFTGFTALPSPSDKSSSWKITLGFGREWIIKPEDLEARWKQLRSKHHPDKGGDASMFAHLKQAYEQGCAALGVEP